MRAVPTGVQSSVSGFITYPNTGPTSVGNESTDGFSDQTAVGAVGPVSAAISGTSTGVDYNATSGTGTINGTVVAQYGVLSSFTDANVQSTPPANAGAPFPHGGTGLSGYASFGDTITISNANYGAFVPVVLHAKLDWSRGYDSLAGGSNFGETSAVAQIGLDWAGSLTLYNLVRSDVATPTLDLDDSYSVSALNNTALGFWGTLSTSTGAVLNAQGTVPAPYGEATAFNNAIARYYLEVPEGTVITSASGYDYSAPAATIPSVPDTGSVAGLIGGAMILLVGLQRWRAARVISSEC